jgi:hypothetical protein
MQLQVGVVHNIVVKYVITNMQLSYIAMCKLQWIIFQK